MAFYKEPCIHCGAYVDRDVRFCPSCGSRSPFGYQCPTCLITIKKGQALCSGCGRPLYVECPHCGGRTFVDSNCELCGKSLLIPCSNVRCQELQFFQNEKCTACGKKIKVNKKRR